MSTTHNAFRRTKRAAVAVAAAAVLVAVATEPGSAAPDAATAEAFNNGTGSATALGYKANPTNGNLSFGVTVGEAIAGHQNTAATGQSRAINLGVIGVTLAGEGCDGGDPTWAEEEQPHPVIARSGEKGAEEGKKESEYGGIEKFARATTAPFAEAITTIAPMGDPAAFFIDGGRTVTHSGIVNGNTREALARTELGTVSIGGDAIKIKGLTWEAIHRSGAVEESIGRFTIGSLEIGGQNQQLPGDELQQAAALNDALKPFGLAVTPPTIRSEQGIQFVSPLKIGIVPSQERDSVLGAVTGGAQPLRAAITQALIEADCGNATWVTIADIVLGSVTGAGALGIELGGVQATTADFTQFSFGSLPALPALPDVPAIGGDVLGGGAAPGFSNTGAAATPPASSGGAVGGGDTVTTKPISGIAGERGGLMALVAGGGLVLLLATAEADRRKMVHALREIPLEA